MKAEPVLLFACFGLKEAAWAAEFERLAPDVEVRYWPNVGNSAEIDYVLTWDHPPGFLAGFPHLKAIFSNGAGVDQLLRDPNLPQNIPIVRLVDTSLVAAMEEYVLMRVLHHHRGMDAYAARQRQGCWDPLPMRLPSTRVVGVMGLGQLGASCARMLARAGFNTRGWSRRPKSIAGVESWSGQKELSAFLAGCEVLVCLLPLTAATENILNAQLFQQLSPGAFLINVGRGAHLVEQDLLDALASGQLAGATLDVARTEPLPPEHPFWGCERITITPHISAPTSPQTAAPILIHNLERARAGESLANVVDLQSGY